MPGKPICTISFWQLWLVLAIKLMESNLATAVFFPDVIFSQNWIFGTFLRQLPTPLCRRVRRFRRPHGKFQMRIWGIGTFLREIETAETTWMSRWKLGLMVSKWVITYLYMGYMGVITYLLTIYQIPGTSKYAKNISKRNAFFLRAGGKDTSVPKGCSRCLAIYTYPCIYYKGFIKYPRWFSGLFP